MGDPIRVDVAGLSALAARCEQQATAFSGNSGALKVAAGGFPATTAAVHAVSESAVAAGQRISGRLLDSDREHRRGGRLPQDRTE
ncbi:MAG: hypothetical protein WAM92_15120 [Mycobacterium sp.]